MYWYCWVLIGTGVVSIILYVCSVGNPFKGFLSDKKLFKYLVASQIGISRYGGNNLEINPPNSDYVIIRYCNNPFSSYEIRSLGHVRKWTKSHRYLERIRIAGRNLKEEKYEKTFRITLPPEK